MMMMMMVVMNFVTTATIARMVDSACFQPPVGRLLLQGRDLGFNTVLGFFSKLSSGTGGSARTKTGP